MNLNSDQILTDIINRRPATGVKARLSVPLPHYGEVKGFTHYEAYDWLQRVWSVEVKQCQNCFIKQKGMSDPGLCTRPMCLMTKELLDKGIDIRHDKPAKIDAPGVQYPVKKMMILTFLIWMSQRVWLWLQAHPTEIKVFLLSLLTLSIIVMARVSVVKSERNRA